MHRILRRFVPSAGILRNAASRHRRLSSSFPLNHCNTASGESVTTKRLSSSVLTTTGINPTCRIGGTERFESTAVSDALEKMRFLGVADMKDAAADHGISIQSDKDKGTISIADFGNDGMSGWEMVAKIIFKKKDGKEAGKEDDSNFNFPILDQLDAGFNSALLISDRVGMATKCPKSGYQYVWESEVHSAGFHTLRVEIDPAKLIPRGSRITLYLKNDDAARKKVYSLFDDPAVKEETDEKKKTKIWLRNSKEVTTEEYNEFYKKTFDEKMEPLASSHFSTDVGEVDQFRSILYVPSTAANEDDGGGFMNPVTKNIRLHVKGEFVSDGFDRDLFPQYLSFVKGVVDSNDLPFIASPKILLKKIGTMKKRLVGKTFDMIQGISGGDYKKFWDKFGKHLMLGCVEDPENHKRIAPLLRFSSSPSSEQQQGGDITKRISLDEYMLRT